MIISNLRKRDIDSLVRISADVAWEKADEPAREIFIETEKAFGDDLTLNADAFLAGCLVPAMHFGEPRIEIEGDVCPELLESFDTLIAMHALWTDGELKPLAVQAGKRTNTLYADQSRRAAMFLSGGIDSLCSLRRNRLIFPLEHPSSFKDCLMIHGFDIGGVMERGAKYHVFDRAREHMAAVAADADVTLMPVYTNIRHLCDQRPLWLNSFHSAVLAAVGHAFVARMHEVTIGSSYDLKSLHPSGSHPLLDTQYSSSDLRILHKEVYLTRLEKYEIVSDWDVAFQNFRVCLANTPDRLNCGVCEKCQRTRTELVAMGLLDKTTAFVENDITTEELLKYSMTIRGRHYFYGDMIEPLTKRGRLDLVEAIRTKLAET